MELRRSLGLVHVFCIASGAMISSGLFILPGLAHAEAGPAVVASYLIAGLLAITGLLSIAELATAMPKAGGDYFFISRGMGDAVGTVSGLLSWFSLSLKSAFALVGLMAFASLIIPVPAGGRYLIERAVGVLLCAGFVGLNLVGAKEAARLQVALVAGLFALMVFYVVRGFPAIDVSHFEPFAPKGLRAVFATAGLVFVSYGGLLKIACVAEEVKNPGRTIPLGMILSLVVVSIFYTLMILVTSGVLGDKMDGSLTPISDGATAVIGRGGMIAMSIAAICAFLTTANAGIMSASRYVLALSRDGMLPPRFGKVGSRFRTPHAAILVTGGLVTVALFVNLKILVEAASTVFMMSFVLSNIATIVLRESGVQNYRPSFRAPLYPWPQIIGIIAFGFIIVEMGAEAFVILAVLVLAGFCTYWFYGRRGTQRESALLHLVRRIADSRLLTGSLDLELKSILRERDSIVEDRFDKLVEQGPVLDLEGPIDVRDFFQFAAEAIAERVKMTPEELLQLLLAREEDGGTVLSPSLAVPHVVLKGEKAFEILLARSRQGIRFSETAPEVHTVFILLGTKDERHFHLRSLAAIAQTVQSPGFEQRWMSAPNEQSLRDAVLLATRSRG
jgi:basic amino acid/polyamine antiporter, APA family